MRSMIIIILLSLSSSLALGQTSNPQMTFKTFLKAMVQIKNQTHNKKEEYTKAISTLNLQHIEKSLRSEIGIQLSNELIKTLDKIKKIDYSKIPTEVNTPIWYFDKRIFKTHFLEISIIKVKKEWLFSKATFDSLKYYEASLKEVKNVEGVLGLNTFSDKIKSNLPSFMKEKSFLLENWQWPAILFILLLSLFIEKVTDAIAKILLQKNISFIQNTSKHYLEKAVRPLGKIFFILTFGQCIRFIELNAGHLAFVKRGISIALSVFTIWLCQKIIQLASDHFLQNAKKTDTKFDDILIPLLTKTSFIILYLFGAVLIANSLTIDVSNLVAGLGIGGLAFAFAAKDTLANFFGSIMLVLDRPFDIGDVIQAGDIQGTVVEVGFRSTRIRTFYDSIITISNGSLMNRSIDNQGKRRFRRLSTTLGLEYNTSPEKIEAFCEGIRQIVLKHNWTRKDYFNVYFTNFGASSLDIQLMVFWETDDYTREQAEKHRLMIDILRLSKELKVEFAFPTQTLHVYSEEKVTSETFEGQKYLDEGIKKADQLISKPLSLKNPRSNASDEKQFGHNDIGIS